MCAGVCTCVYRWCVSLCVCVCVYLCLGRVCVSVECVCVSGGCVWLGVSVCLEHFLTLWHRVMCWFSAAQEWILAGLWFNQDGDQDRDKDQDGDQDGVQDRDQDGD